MFTEKELLSVIREYETYPLDPETVGNLADLYIVYEHLFGDGDSRQNEAGKITLRKSGSEFLAAVNGKPPDGVWAIMDDLMDTLRVVNEKAYISVMRKIREL